MRGYIDLTKKNLTIIKNYYAILFLSALTIPFVTGRASSVYFGGILPLLLEATFTLYFAYNQLTYIESKYNGWTFLCTTPYKRRTHVLSMYMTVFFEYCVILLLYFILSLLPWGAIPPLTISRIAVVTCFIAVMYGIFIPSLYLLGYDKAKYVPAVATFVIPYAAVLISKIPFSKVGISFDIQSIKSYALPFLCIIVLCFLCISIKMAERWYERMEM